MNSMDLQSLQNYAVCSYLKQLNNSYPLDLAEIIVSFLGNFLLRFDITNAVHKHDIENNGMLINRTMVNKSFVNAIFGCSLGINRGITKFNVKLLQYINGESIGIISDINQCKQTVWMYDLKGYKYWWSGATEHWDGSIFIQNNRRELNKQKIDSIRKEGDIVTVKVNCNEWNVTFYLNDKSVTEKIPIQPNLTYYFAICFQKIGKYQLVL